MPFQIYIALMIAAIVVTTLFLFLVFARKKKSKKPAESAALFSQQKNFAQRIKTLWLNSAEDLTTTLPQIEEILLTADVGVAMTESLLKTVFKNHQPQTGTQAIAALKQEIAKQLTPAAPWHCDSAQKPCVIYLVGVNGVGKTTTIGKLAKQFKDQGKKVLLVAADTFRAAAVEQLRQWAQKNGVAFSGGRENSDPSAAIVDGLQKALAQNADVVLVDTAGRLHTKSNLMEELKKMTRMSEKVLAKAPDQTWLVIDAITGQNGFQQANIFWEASPLTGVILTKYDATAKGGVILSIVKETKLPIRYIGLGEGIDDLQPFDPQAFVTKIFG